eukprot:CAMPEP_0185689158 /NCGR_PEP_ID=MMETSP1164-20130828/295_1 /TAXON_ID=1104430 /ORGANISM="Chrysoreinhardia sp, Strain CCMP2950" /LENGTH=384 /DNA_ID=CAMNT_0028355645 /DNA_START=34 /DNA_END=1186 /DNA_ORIENTATION=+
MARLGRRGVVVVTLATLASWSVGLSSDENYYRVLGVSPSASPEQIRTAFREKSKALHPDKRCSPARRSKKDAAAKACADLSLVNAQFARVTTAYDVLRDEKKRRDYDAQLAAHGYYYGGVAELIHAVFRDLRREVRRFASVPRGVLRFARKLARRSGLSRKRVKPSHLGVTHAWGDYDDDREENNAHTPPPTRAAISARRRSLVAAFAGFSTPVTFVSFFRRLCKDLAGQQTAARAFRRTGGRLGDDDVLVERCLAIDCTRLFSCAVAPRALRPLPAAAYVDASGRLWRINATTVPRATREVRRIDARAAYDAQYRSVDDLRRVLLRKYGDPCSLCEPFDRDAYLDRLADLEIAAPPPRTTTTTTAGSMRDPESYYYSVVRKRL